jgi:hypothetical protein
MKKLSLEEITQEEKLRSELQQAVVVPKVRYVKITFLIATEGMKTEPIYFNALKKELEATNRFNIEVSVEGKGIPTLDLVRKVIRQVENNHQEYDRVWAVFDKDDFKNFDDAIYLASQHNVKCAWSNECFELWLLLHFKDVLTSTRRENLFDELETAICEAMRRSNPSAIYRLSKGEKRIYEFVNTLGNESDAINRAAKLKSKFGTASKPSNQNPCTHVDELILELRHPEKFA